MSTVLPGYADRVGPKIAFDKVKELINVPSPENDQDLKIVLEGLNASYPTAPETAQAVQVTTEKRPDLAERIFTAPNP